jgi:uncharacterized protein (DUF2267 family)
VQYADLREIVAARAHLDPAAADRALEATVVALAEGIAPEVIATFRQYLPPALANPAGEATHRGARELQPFLQRVAELSELPSEDTSRPVRAVFAALAEALPPGGLHTVLEPLGPEYTNLLPPPQELQDRAVFIETVRDRAGAETSEEAEAATGLVLAALAERLSAGQAHQLAGSLPDQLCPLLENTRSDAAGFDYTEFLARIAEQRQTAETRARAVLSTLRETAPETDIHNALAQLPDPLSRLFT